MTRIILGALALSVLLAATVEGTPTQLAFSMDGKRLGAAFSRGEGQSARVWVAELQVQRLVMEFQPEYDVITALALSRMGNAVYLGLPDGRIAVYGPGASELDLWQAHEGPVMRLHLLLPPLSDMNTFLVSAEPGGRIRGWANGRARLVREFQAAGPIRDAQPAGRTAVAALGIDGAIEVFDFATSRSRTPLEESHRSFTSIAGSPLWPHLVGLTAEGVMVHWQGAGLAARSFEPGGLERVTALTLSASGRTALAATADGGLKQISLMGEQTEDRLATPRRITGLASASGAALFGVVLEGEVYQLLADPGETAETQGVPAERLRLVDPSAMTSR